ncbi:MAG TPA: AI-2E family transporter, partial [Myxococcota bacterium]|nr:AI-2E family transporter [Myxococcota bacterium]
MEPRGPAALLERHEAPRYTAAGANMATELRQDTMVRLTAVLALAVGCAVVLRPFVSAALLATVICTGAWPLYRGLRTLLRGSATAAAAVMTLLLVLVVLLPMAGLATWLVDQLPGWVQLGRAYAAQAEHPAPAWLTDVPWAGPWAADYWEQLAGSREELLAVARRVWQPMQGFVLDAGAVVGRGITELALSVFISFFFFRDGDALVAAIRRGLGRVDEGTADQVLEIVDATIKGVILGIVGTSIAQGSVAVLGFLLVGLPGAWALGGLTTVVSVVPAGPPLIWGSATAWLLSEGRVAAAIFMGIWGFFGISGIDNVVKPLLISRGSSLPFVLVLLGVLGGLIAFGFVGVFLGPVLLAVGFT